MWGTSRSGAQAAGITVPLLGGDGWDSDGFRRSPVRPSTVVLYEPTYAPDRPTPEVVEFVSKYKATYGGRIPDGLAALGYDAAKVRMFGRDGARGFARREGSRRGDRSDQGFQGRDRDDHDRREPRREEVGGRSQMVGGQRTYRATIEPRSKWHRRVPTQERDMVKAGEGLAIGSPVASSVVHEHIPDLRDSPTRSWWPTRI